MVVMIFVPSRTYLLRELSLRRKGKRASGSRVTDDIGFSPIQIYSHLNCLVDGRGMKTLRRFLADESAATAIEYALIAAGIAIAIISAVKGVGTQLSTKFNAISSSLK